MQFGVDGRRCWGGKRCFGGGREIIDFPLYSLANSMISVIPGDPPLSLWKPFPSAFALDLDIERPGDEGRLVVEGMAVVRVLELKAATSWCQN